MRKTYTWGALTAVSALLVAGPALPASAYSPGSFSCGAVASGEECNGTVVRAAEGGAAGSVSAGANVVINDVNGITANQEAKLESDFSSLAGALQGQPRAVQQAALAATAVSTYVNVFGISLTLSQVTVTIQ
ncbi:hypothetical protein ACFVQ9_28075 [Streptomyces goshikiensis]|uniref:hypothetical protein n=1 Tax=Streptomyces goshikiensis TaxID=1942 RepID=UPI003682C1EE